MTIKYIGHKTLERTDGNPVDVEYEFNTKTGDIIEIYEECADVIDHADTIIEARKQHDLKSPYKNVRRF